MLERGEHALEVLADATQADDGDKGAQHVLAAPVQLAPNVVRPKSSTVSATRRPLPIGPRIFAAGTGMLWKARRAVAVPRMPHLGMRASTTSKPGRSGVTRNAVIFVSL